MYATSSQVRKRYGGISDMTLWRWLKDESLGFPKALVFNRRRYWALEDLDAFDSRKASGAGAVARRTLAGAT